MAPTGSAAKLLDGSTIHSKLACIPGVTASEMPLSTRQSLKTKLDHVDYFVVDESSMCGLRMIQLLDSRLKAIFDSTKMFGGKSMILVGDIHQIPPVRDIPTYERIFDVTILTDKQHEGYIAWK